MTMKTARLRLTVIAILPLLAACSGDDKGDGNTGSGGTGGTSSNGAAGKAAGGKAGSTSAAGSNASSGSNNGGTGNNTGGFSFGGTGGFNPDDYMCDPVPEIGSDCADGTQPCLNGMDVCSCQMGKWDCADLGLGEGGGPGGFGEIECPEAKPMSGSACGDTVGVCTYGGQDGCVCVDGSWTCN